MNVELYGGGFHNRGAQLMLEECAARFGKRGSACCMEDAWSTSSQRDAVGLSMIMPSARQTNPRQMPYRLKLSWLTSGMLPGPFLARRGGVRRRDIGALVDISGYSYGDKWGEVKAKNFCIRAKYFKDRGCPVVLMPQMFGPFENPDLASWFREIVDVADLVFVRDSYSRECVAGLVGDEREHVRLCPDLTIAAKPEAVGGPLGEERGSYCCVVPNVRMLDMAGMEPEEYVDSLVRFGELAIGAGKSVYVVVHDAEGLDRGIACQVVERLGLGDEAIVQDASPWKLKSVLGGSFFVVGSRFHALVAALSQGVPAFAMGWAHKYQGLLDDFGVGSYCMGAGRGSEQLLGDAELLLGSSRLYEDVVAKVTGRGESQGLVVEEMWREVLDLIGRGAC